MKIRNRNMNAKKIYISLLIIVTATMGLHASGSCQRCDPFSTSCDVGSAASGNCNWEGGALCTGFGSCIGEDSPTITEAQCVDDKDGSYDPGTCSVLGADYIYSKCRKKCTILPFISCNCEIGGTGSVGVITTGHQHTRCP